MMNYFATNTIATRVSNAINTKNLNRLENLSRFKINQYISSNIKHIEKKRRLSSLLLILIFTFYNQALFALAPKSANAINSNSTTGSYSNLRESAPIQQRQSSQAQTAWKIAYAYNLENKSKHCQLTTNPVQVHDGVGNTYIKLMFTDKDLFVLTDSNIDITYKKSGLLIDSTKKFEFDRVINKTNVVISYFTRENIQLLRNSKTATVKIGFWPTWPKTKVTQATFNLKQFNKKYSAFIKCINKEHIEL